MGGEDIGNWDLGLWGVKLTQISTHVPSTVLWEGNTGLSSPCCLRQHFRLQPELQFTTCIDCSSGLLRAAQGANNTL